MITLEIKFNQVSFKYNKKKEDYALKKINLLFNKSEIVFVMGSTGSGKSTLVQHLNGLLIATSGQVSIEIDNQKFILDKFYKEKNINKLRENVGFVFQFPEYQLFETNVLKDVMFGPYNFFKDEKKAKELAIKALKEMGVGEEYYDRSPFELSGGEKRKVAIAGVLASNPRVVILDEPTSSLDPIATRDIMGLVKRLKEEGKLVIVISHDTDLCYEYADRVIILNKGEIIKDCSVCEAFEDYRVLKDSCLEQPFILKVKNKIGIKDEKIKSIESLKEVLKDG